MPNVYSLVDENGYYLEPVTFENDVLPIDDNIIVIPLPVGIHLPARFDHDSNTWISEYVPENSELEKAKKAKVDELRTICEERIIADYRSHIVIESTGKTHVYGCELTDQQNFTSKLTIISLNRGIYEQPWITKDSNVPVIHTREEFIAVATEISQKIENCIFKNKELRDQVYNAETIEEVNAINWD